MADVVKWELVVDTRTGVASLGNMAGAQDKVSSSMKKMGTASSDLHREMSKIRSQIGMLLGVVGIGALAKSFIAAADSAEKYKIRLGGLLGSQKEGNALFKEMQTWALTIPFKVDDVIESVTKLTAVMGGGVKEAKAYMPLVADLAARTGQSISETSSLLIRMYTSGTSAMRGTEGKIIKSYMGLGPGENLGPIAAQQKLIDSWVSGTSKFRGAAADMAKTYGGMKVMMKEQWGEFQETIMMSGPFQAIEAVMGKLMGKISSMAKSGELKKLADEVGGVILRIMKAVILDVGKALDLIIPIISTIGSTIGGMVDTFLSLDPMIQDVGLIGFLFFGIKGKAVIAGALLLLENAKKDVEGIKKEGFIKYMTDFKGIIKDIQENIYKGAPDLSNVKGNGSVTDQLFAPSPSKVGEEKKKPLYKDLLSALGATNFSELFQKLVNSLENIGKDIGEETRKLQVQTFGYVSIAKDSAEAASYISVTVAEATGNALKIALAKMNYELENVLKLHEKELEELDQMGASAGQKTAYILALKTQISAKYGAQIGAAYGAAGGALAPLGFSLEELNRPKERRAIGKSLILEGAKVGAMGTGLGKDLAQVEFEKKQAIFDAQSDEERKKLIDAGLKKIEIEQVIADRITGIERKAAEDRKKILLEEQTNKLDATAQYIGEFASLFQQFGQQSKKHQAEMFAFSKVFSIAETIINTSTAVMKALAQGGVFGIATATAIGVLGAGKVALIASQNPQSYDEGGVSTKKGIYYSGVPEAHIPLKGGAVPVKFVGGGSTGQTVNVILNNPVFQDLETQRAAMTIIAATVTKQLAPNVVATNYLQDGIVRRTVRGGF